MAASHSRDRRHTSSTLEAGGTLDPMDNNFAWLGILLLDIGKEM